MKDLFRWLIPLSLTLLYRRTNSFFGMWGKAFLQIVSPILFLFGIGSVLVGWWKKRWGQVVSSGTTAVLAAGYLYLLFKKSKPDETVEMKQLFKQVADKRFVPWRDMKRGVSLERINDVRVGVHPTDKESPILADLWLPESGKSRSKVGIIYLHGSAWHYLDKGFGTDDWFRQLVGAGHLVLDVGYHLAPKSRIPEQVEDVKQAIHWLKEHAEQYGIDQDKIIVMGGSAGGHLALMAAYTADDTRFLPTDLPKDADLSVAGVASLYGPADLISLQKIFEQRFKAESIINRPVTNEPLLQWLKKIRFLPSYGVAQPLNRLIPEAMGVEIEDGRALYQQYAPISYVSKDVPPTLILQGGDDWGIAETSRALYLLLREAGAAVRYVEYPNSEHAFDLPLMSPGGQLALEEMLRFCEMVRVSKSRD